MAYAIDDPHAVWNELESDHFVIHYPADRTAFARRALAIAEEAHGKLTPLLKWQPAVKTHISVTDLTDDANGWARTVPRNEIRLQAYPPYFSDELGFYDDWLRQLVYHEYVHILHTDTSHGLHPVLNAIFGKFARNNATTPRWYAEGLAVYYETRMSNTGRLRNALYKTMLFNAAKDGTIPDFGSLNAEILRWPGESSHYLFGSFFIAYISKTYGEDSLTRWNHEYGDDWIPYAMNRAALQIWHKTWDDLYDEWRQSAIAEALEKSDSETETTPHARLVEPWRHTRPQIRENDLIYVRNDGFHPKAIVIKRAGTSKETELAECWGRCEHHLSKDGKTLYFTHAPVIDGYRRHETLYAYDFDSHEIAHIGLPGRIRSFAVDGDDIYRVIQDGESNQIWRANLSTDRDICVYRGEPFEQIEDLTVRDGVIAASVFSPKKQRVDLNILENGAWVPLADDKFSEISAFWFKDGTIGYISDASGDLNLWRADPRTHEKQRLTNLHDGIIQPSESPQGDIYYTMYTSSGTTIGMIRASDLAVQPEIGARPALNVHFDDLPDTSHIEERPYKPYQHLWPQAWMPRFSWSEQDKAAFGIAVSASDFLGHHALAFSFDYLTQKNAVNFNLAYSWTSLLWDLSFQAGLRQDVITRVDNFMRKVLEYQTFSASASAARVWNGRIWAQTFQLVANASFSEAHDSQSWSRRDPAAAPVWQPSFGWHNALIAQYALSTMRSQERAVRTNHGYFVQASLRFEAPWIGAQSYRIQGRLSAAAAWPMPYLASHIFSLKLAGAASWSQDGDQPFQLSSASGLSIGTGDVQLHGYPAGLIFGRHYLYGHASYAAPIWDIQAGHSTLPVGFSRLSFDAFGEWGYAWGDSFDITRSKFALGLNLMLDIQIGYRLPVRLTLGYAWGGAPDGGHALHFYWTY